MTTDTSRTVNGAPVTFVELKDANVVYDSYIAARGRHVVSLNAVWDQRYAEAGTRVLELFDGLMLDLGQPPGGATGGVP